MDIKNAIVEFYKLAVDLRLPEEALSEFNDNVDRWLEITLDKLEPNLNRFKGSQATLVAPFTIVQLVVLDDMRIQTDAAMRNVYNAIQYAMDTGNFGDLEEAASFMYATHKNT